MENKHPDFWFKGEFSKRGRITLRRFIENCLGKVKISEKRKSKAKMALL